MVFFLGFFTVCLYNTSMKIRTITIGINLNLPLNEAHIRRAASDAQKVRASLQNSGYTVQTVRLTTQPWEKYYDGKAKMKSLLRRLSSLLPSEGFDYFSLGTTFSPQNIPLIFSWLETAPPAFATTMICDRNKVNHEAVHGTVKLIKKLAGLEPRGFANLRFAALFNTPPGSAFFPAAYHQGTENFTLGTENSDLVNRAFSEARDIRHAEETLEKILSEEYGRLEEEARKISSKTRLRYGGIDTSIAPSVLRQNSLAFAFEKLRLGKFGESGTLASARIVTRVLEKLNVKACGYAGLMLPVLEDYGLALRNSQGKVDLTHLLLYSAVCGTGLDTVPLAGDISEKKLYALLLDIAALAIKLNKPLSARLMPIPGKKVGDMTDFDFSYFANTKVISL
ncbi:MAG: DUF711 family protein [Candidatus Aminicenantes bacterium]|nr:DUF711 family protein [Candidatus Aminicenantes bacterium]